MAARGIARLLIEKAKIAVGTLSAKYNKNPEQAFNQVRQVLDGSIAKSGNPYVIETLSRTVQLIDPDMVTKTVERSLLRSGYKRPLALTT